jgi:ABC-type transporter Mla maintaining outer membrane lipid asymmetry ATPase subunit MlaF
MSSPAVVFENVSFAFDELVILRNVSFEVPTGSLRFLLGASGSGKSVLLKLILGLFRPDSGRILVNGHRIDNMPERELLALRSDIGMVFQEHALFDSFTVNENVGYRLYEETKMPLDEVRARVSEVLGFIGLSEYMERLPSELSGGQRRRVGIARAITSRPKLVLFADPTTSSRSRRWWRRIRCATRSTWRTMRPFARAMTCGSCRRRTRWPRAWSSWCCTTVRSSSKVRRRSCSHQPIRT